MNLFLLSVALISNIGLLTAEALTGEPNEEEPAFNKELSPDNVKVTALYLIPPTNGSGSCNYIGGYIFDYSKEGVLVGKTDIESMLDESDFGATTEMGGFVLESLMIILLTRTFWTSIFTSSVLVGAAVDRSVSTTFV